MTAGEAVNLLHKIKTRESTSTTPQWDWEEWKHNFCQNIDNWSYITAEDNLEIMKKTLISQALQQERERLLKDTYLWISNDGQTNLREYLNQPKKE